MLLQLGLPSSAAAAQVPAGHSIPGPVAACADGPEPALSFTVRPGTWQQTLQALKSLAPDRAVSLQIEERCQVPWPAEAELSALVDAGVVDVSLSGRLDLAADAGLGFIRFLRDCCSHRLRVRWRGSFSRQAALALGHLEPPLASDGEPEGAAAWRAAYEYGQCYWRNGPGFVLIRDARAGRDAAQFVLDDEVSRGLFATLQAPTRLSELPRDAATQSVLREFLDDDLAIVLGESAVMLPYRMRYVVPVAVDI